MKNLKKILFSMLLLFVGILTVNAEDAPATNIPLWDSIVTDMTANISGKNNCSVVQSTTMLDTFTVGNDCIATGIAKGNDYLLVGRADSGSGDGATYHGNVVDSVNDTSNTTVLLTEIVELIYNENSASTKKVIAKALSQNSSATGYVLKAGSSDDALYVYGGYEGGEMAGIKITFSESNQKLSYSITETADNTAELQLATYFTWYLIDYIMEASPNYTDAIAIVNDQNKMDKIKADFTTKYGEVIRTTDPLKIEVGVFAKGTINNDIISLYQASLENNNDDDQKEEVKQEDENDDNPNTGAFVNIFAVVALLSVGTVLVLGNKRKLFRI